MKYVDGYVLPVPKKTCLLTGAWQRKRERFGENTAPWNSGNVSATISRQRWPYRSLA